MKCSIKKVGQALSIAMLSALGSQAIADNYALGVASCPPWKKEGSALENKRMLDMCPRDMKLMMTVLQDRFDISTDNTTTLVQKDATPQNLYDKFTQLRAKLTPEDTLFLYQMSHGGILPYTYKGYKTTGEIFAYYTTEQPSNVGTAVQDGLWISARDLRDEIYELGETTGANIVVIIESCHSGAVGHQITYNPYLHLNAKHRTSFIFSAQAKQLATFNDDGTGGRFTEELIAAIRSAKKGTSLDDIFSSARRSTHRGAMESCNAMGVEDLRKLYTHTAAYFAQCTQEPAFVDPRGLMIDVVVN